MTAWLGFFTGARGARNTFSQRFWFSLFGFLFSWNLQMVPKQRCGLKVEDNYACWSLKKAKKNAIFSENRLSNTDHPQIHSLFSNMINLRLKINLWNLGIAASGRTPGNQWVKVTAKKRRKISSADDGHEEIKISKNENDFWHLKRRAFRTNKIIWCSLNLKLLIYWDFYRYFECKKHKKVVIGIIIGIG